MLPPAIYGLYVFCSEKPVVFSGIYFAWFFNPHIGFINDTAEVEMVNFIFKKIKFYLIASIFNIFIAIQ